MNKTKPDFWESLSPAKAAIVTVLVPSLYFLALVVAWFAPKQFGFGVRPLVYVGLTVGLSGVVPVRSNTIAHLAIWRPPVAHCSDLFSAANSDTIDQLMARLMELGMPESRIQRSGE